MAERRFTRLKASLSENAAKTRENVSRELRHSLVANADALAHHFDENYEEFARHLETQSGVAFPQDDIAVVDHTPTTNCPPLDEVGGGFARECVRQLSGRRRRVSFTCCSLLGSVFECFETKRELKPQVFTFDDSDDDARVLRQTNCLMNRMTGWLALHTQHHTCALVFFRDRKRSQVVWTQEVTHAVTKSTPTSFKIDCHSIEMSAEDIDLWIQDINDTRFDVKRHVTRLKADLRTSLDDFFAANSLNLFATCADLRQRRGVFAALRERAPQRRDDQIVCFIAAFEKFETNDNKSKDSFGTRVALFDSSFGRISEEFRIDFTRPTKRVFLVDLRESKPNDVFLVARVERLKALCAHSEPFVWGARPLFKPDSRDVEPTAPINLFYRATSASDEHVTAALSSAKGTTVSARLSLRLSSVKSSSEKSCEEVLCLRAVSDPVTRFEHWLFVCAHSLRFESQKVFSKARNIQIAVEVRDDDLSDAPALALIEGRPGQPSFVTEAHSAVTRHNVNPDFYEEIKIQIPLKVSEKLHVLFRLFHVSCKKECVRSSVGFAWLPINNKSTVGEHALSVFASLPDHYLQCQSLGLGRGLSMPDMRLLGKDLLRVSCRLVSSLMSSDASIETTMECVTAINNKDTEISRAVSCERSLQKNLRALATADKKELIRFSHVILQQLLRLTARPTGDQTLRALLALLESLRPEVLWEFCETEFESERDFHVSFVAALNRLLRDWPETEDESRVLLRHLWFLTRVHVRACVDHLFRSDALRRPREKRFDDAFATHVRQLVSSLSSLVVNHSRLEEATAANRALSHYVTRLLSLTDRALAFQVVWAHLQNTFSRDIVISELRLTTLAIVTAHEHHVALNHPLPEMGVALSDDFRRRHFSVFLLLQEFKHSLQQSVRHTRQQALHVLRNLLAKHSFDDRYDVSRVVALYLPLVDIVLDNVARIIEPKARLEDRSPEVSHTRHNSLPVRFDAFNNDEIKDILVCFAFVAKHLDSAHVTALSPERADQCLHVLQTAVHVFEFNDDNEMRAKTLPNDMCALASLHEFLCRQNASVQIALITLRTARLLLSAHASEARVLERVMATLVTLVVVPQSLALLVHSFENIRFFATNHAPHAFASPLFPQLVARLVHFLDSPLKAARDACVDLLFCLFGVNFRRTRFETIVCVSRLASKDDAKDLSRFQTSLTRLDALADESEPRLKQTVQRVRDILTATHRIRSEARNEYESCELRLFLANSYAQTSLRRTWLENLAEWHRSNLDWPELAMCLAHVIAIVVHELASKGVKELDSAHNQLILLSANLSAEEEVGGEDGDWLEPDDTSLDTLRLLVDECVAALVRAQLFELAVHALKVLVLVHERHHEHKQLAALYTRLAQMHSRAQELNDSGKRLFDTYFRVAFCCSGQPTDEFIYRESKVVSLAEMTQKLRRLHPNATIGDSSDASIVVTHVSPEAPAANNLFERHVGVNRFQYEQRLSSADASVAQQRKKRVVLQTQHFLPFCVKRVPVVDRHETVLSPIEVAIDEMTDRVHQLERVIQSEDVKHLQLVLQGSVQVQVNAGPLAYAEAFLAREDDDDRQRLKALFARFLDLCEKALRANERLIKADQLEYQLALRTSFERLRAQLEVHEPKRTSVQIFDVISGSSLA